MSCNFCPCNGRSLNTGTPKNQRIVKSGVKFWIVPIVADDGTKNQILESDTLDASFFGGKINEPDPSKRWYPVGKLRSITDERGDPITETFNDGSSSITQQGIRAYSGMLVDYAPVYKGKLDSLACDDFGIYVIDECGDLVGSFCSNGGGAGVAALRPIRVNKDSFEARVTKANETLRAKVMVNFEFDQLERDENLRVLLASEMDNVNLLDYEGLIDVNADYETVPPTVDTITTTVTQDFDTVFIDREVSGLLVANFNIFNLTTNAAVVPSLVAEAPVGTYAVTIPAQTVGNVLRVRIVGAGVFNEQQITLQ